MASGNDHQLVEIAAELVPLAAEGCTIDLVDDGGLVCVAASHVDGAIERDLYDRARRAPHTALSRCTIVCAGEPAGEIVAWGSRTLPPLGEALVCAAAGHVGAILEARRERRRADEAEAARASIVAMVGHEVGAPLEALTVGLDLLPDDDLGVIADGVAGRLREAAEWAGCPIEVTKEGSLRGRWDRVHVETIIENLLTNAIKYGAGRLVSVKVSGSPHEVGIEVVDRGCGIARGERERIFERFFRGVAPGHHTGLGVGLWIVKKLVDAHGGTVACESSPGEGSTFRVTLPRDVSRADRVRAPSESLREGPRH
jgi:anti-sigma regulatory factor (Ser/Thr protein kinase)